MAPLVTMCYKAARYPNSLQWGRWEGLKDVLCSKSKGIIHQNSHNVHNNQPVTANTFSFLLLGCEHSFNILENRHVKKGYMELYVKKGII